MYINININIDMNLNINVNLSININPNINIKLNNYQWYRAGIEWRKPVSSWNGFFVYLNVGSSKWMYKIASEGETSRTQNRVDFEMLRFFSMNSISFEYALWSNPIKCGSRIIICFEIIKAFISNILNFS